MVGDENAILHDPMVSVVMHMSVWTHENIADDHVAGIGEKTVETLIAADTWCDGKMTRAFQRQTGLGQDRGNRR